MPKMMKPLDDNIGRVLRASSASWAWTDDTIVVFTSDNGGERFCDTWPFTGKKTELLEGGLRVPGDRALARRGARRQPAATAPIMSMDWLPTFVAAGGGQRSMRLSQATVPISGPGAGRRRPAGAHAILALRQQAQRARCGGATYKYLKINDNEFLFDVAADPLERGNLKLPRSPSASPS